MGGLYFTVFPTGVGWMGLVGSEAGLVRVILPCSSEDSVLRAIGGGVVPALERFRWLEERLKSYFSGSRTDFSDVALDLEFHRATPFRRAVWEATRSIPYGVTKGYRWVAERAGRAGAVRAVGQALSRNPYPVVVPCHRVIGSDGSPGGYSGGPALKRLLLRLEGCLPGT